MGNDDASSGNGEAVPLHDHKKRAKGVSMTAANHHYSRIPNDKFSSNGPARSTLTARRNRCFPHIATFYLQP